MRPVLTLLPVLALVACQTPQEACLSAASRDLRVIEGLIRETQGNLARGYAVEEDQEIRVLTGLCRDDDDEEEERFFCDRTEVRDVSRPVAIDLDDERRQLESLTERRAALLAQRQARVQACQAAYPAG